MCSISDYNKVCVLIKMSKLSVKNSIKDQEKCNLLMHKYISIGKCIETTASNMILVSYSVGGVLV